MATSMAGEVKCDKLTPGRGPGHEEVCGPRQRACERDIGAYSAIRIESHAKMLMTPIGDLAGNPALERAAARIQLMNLAGAYQLPRQSIAALMRSRRQRGSADSRAAGPAFSLPVQMVGGPIVLQDR
jgi:hypothetical protein